MQTLWQDLRYGARMLVHHRGFTTIAVLTLALGIGANTLIFSLLNTLYWRPLPVPDPTGLVHVFSVKSNRPGYNALAFPDYEVYRDRSHVFADVGAHYASAPINFVFDAGSKEINGSVVTANYFGILGLEPALGRFFTTDEDRVADGSPVAVISHDWWRRQFEADPGIIGKSVRLNGTPFTIVGVAPPKFQGVFLGGLAVDVWLPSAMFRVGYRYCDARTDRDCRIVELLGRLKAGRTVKEAQSELTVLAQQLETAYPETNKGWGVAVVPIRGVVSEIAGDESRTPELLAAAVGLLLLIACANVAGLLLARALTRRKEIAVRAAMGASRGRLVRQLLTESVMLALVGGAAAVIVAVWTKDLLLGFYTANDEGQRAYFSLDPDPMVFAFTFAVSVLTGAIFGLVPARQGSRPDLLSALKDQQGAGFVRSRVRDGLVVAQVALSVVLLVAAGLVTRSLANVYRGPGYDPSHVALLRLRPSLVAQRPEKAKAYHEEVLRRLSAVPGVVSASPAAFLPLPGWDNNVRSLWLPDAPPSRPDAPFQASWNRVGPRYFETVGIAMIEGRDFDERDRVGAAEVAIVNDVLARHYWPGESGVGKTLVVNGRTQRIIGVVTSAQYLTRAQQPRPFVYTNFWQNPDIDRNPADSRTHVRVAGDARTALPAIRRAVASVDPDVPISEDRPLTEWLDYTFRPVRVAGTLLACFSGLALFLSAIGVYGVLAATVAHRTREIAIRVALGAERREIARLVVLQGARLTLTGAAIGLVAALASTGVLKALLYGVETFDPLSIGAVSSVVAGAALAAIYLPARRAMRVDPMTALRYD